MAQNTIHLPREIYDAVRRQAAAQQKTPDMLVTEWVSAHLETGNRVTNDELTAFEQEIAAFEALKPALLEQYRGQYVAIYQGEVVASGERKLDVSRQVRESHGPVIYYVELVAEDAPRKVRIPSVWAVRA